jgi:NADPH-dependent glutamate synthase beta subunit-like oxidoreductase
MNINYKSKKSFSGMKVGIIGAVPAGLTAAYKLCSQGANVTVF